MLKLGDFEVVRVSEDIPYLGFVRFYEMPDQIFDEHEWICQAGVNGVYQLVGVEHAFFIQNGEIRFDGGLKTHPIIEHLESLYGTKENKHDRDDGPLGGAFSSERDYWRYREGNAFVNSVDWS
jgi:hypothetical protein